MTTFVRLALITTFATYFLIFIGGLVRVSGAGLGCPDWPHCYGGWFPPVSEYHLSQRLQEQAQDNPALLDEVDPDTFNFTLAWIEYVNRLVGVVIGLLILATAIGATRWCRQHRRILLLAWGSVLLVIFQGWLGGQVVASELKPWLVSVHMIVALLMVSILLYLCLAPLYLQAKPTLTWRRASQAIGGIWLLSLVQLTLGALLRGRIENIERAYPLFSDAMVFEQLGPLKYVHIGLGVVLGVAGIVVGVRTIRAGASGLARHALRAVVALAAIQIVAGLLFRHFGLAPILQVFHLWLASLWIGALFVAWRSLRVEQPVQAELPNVSRWLTAGMALVVIAALLGLVTIHLAEESRRQLEVIRQAPEFSLTTSGGKTFTEEDFAGKITVLQFMFTRCPSICPMMTSKLANMYELYDHSDAVQFVQITVDPDYDSPQVLEDFADQYGRDDDRWVLLHGPEEPLKQVAETGFQVRSDFPNHSTKFILIDPQGRLRGYFEYSRPASMNALRAAIRQLHKENFLP